MAYNILGIFFLMVLASSMWLGSSFNSIQHGNIPYDSILAFFGTTASFFSALIISIRKFRHNTKKELAVVEEKLARTEKTTAIPNLIVSPESQDPQFHLRIEKLLKTAERVILIGTGLNVIQNDSIRHQLFNRALNKKCKLEIYLADPESPSIEHRLIEEELGEKRPPVSYTGLVSRLSSLIGDWRKLNCPEYIKINVFSNYPTFALMIIDEDYYFYPYAFATLGNYSPVFCAKKTIESHKNLVEFLKKHYELQKKHSVELDRLDAYRKKIKTDPSGLLEFAIYFIPAEETKLYRIGSDILGYDVRKRDEIESKWVNVTGDAKHFGFHITISDKLFFLQETEIQYITEEIKFILSKFTQFKLSSLTLRKAYPNKNSISLTVSDSSGQLEAMHHEFVQRVYRRAIGSSYSFGKAQLDRDNRYERARNMIKRYQAPYILGSYIPHFTLLTKVPEHEMDKVYEEIKHLFAHCHDEYIEVEKVAIMKKKPGKDFWEIEKEIFL